MNSNQIAEVVSETVLASLKEEEQKIDAEIYKLNNLNDEEKQEMEDLRRKRLEKMQKNFAKNKEFKAKGHGEYADLADQKDFFTTTKTSQKVVVHLYSKTNPHTPVLDKHLQVLTTKHLETKFCRLDAEKAEYLVRKLGIWMMPCLLLCKDREVAHVVQGLDEFGGEEKFSTMFLEYYLSRKDMIQYDGPVPESYTDTNSEPTEQQQVKQNKMSTIHQSIYYDSDLELEDD